MAWLIWFIITPTITEQRPQAKIKPRFGAEVEMTPEIMSNIQPKSMFSKTVSPCQTSTPAITADTEAEATKAQFSRG